MKKISDYGLIELTALGEFTIYYSSSERISNGNEQLRMKGKTT